MTSQIEAWLSEGDLRSDGDANLVAEFVRLRLEVLPDLVQALAFGSLVVRGHAADALEKVARSEPEAVAALRAPAAPCREPDRE